MEKVIELLEEKGVIERIKRTTKIANKIANFLEIKSTEEQSIKAI